ncbi:hypothetical protein ACP4J4_01690 [Aureimonas ureilytica]|uniref:hypothetical protein n=1 Tax=Aureimonas ureilytica TaxID=401562 RepID=UPI003CE9286A
MFEPWIGENYGKAGDAIGGRRLMILGESHYTETEQDVGTSPAGFTSRTVRSLGIEGRHLFFARLQEIVTERKPEDQTAAEKSAFWKSVAFYNYVPVLADGRPVAEGGAARRPTQEMFRAGAEPFHITKRCVQPHAIIVCGIELWNWLAPNLEGYQGPARDIIFYDDGEVMYARTHHPSWRFFKPSKWYPRTRKLLELSGEPRELGRKVLWTPQDG